MKLLLLLSILSALAFELNKISQANELKNKAANYYKRKEYLMAIRYYQELQAVYGINEEALQVNLAHSYFKIATLIPAASAYKKLLHSSDSKIRSLVNHQLGVIAAYQGKGKIALAYFKNAMIANFTNEQARYNYEVIFKKLKQEGGTGKSKSSQTANENQQNTQLNESFQQGEGMGTGASNTTEQKVPNNSIGTGQEYTQQTNSTNPSNESENLNDVKINENGSQAANALQTKKFNEIHMTEARAKQLLESMKEQEFLILQQQKKPAQSKTKIDQDW